MMHLLHCMHFFCAIYDIKIKGVHVEGKKNVAADAIFCNLPQVFYQKVPNASYYNTPVPRALWQLLVMNHQIGAHQLGENC